MAAGETVPDLGRPDFTVSYGGYTFWFMNASNAATFVANPSRYIPAWGGFCAWGISREGTDGNPSPAAEIGWPWSTRHMGPPCNPHNGWVVLNDRLFCAISRGYINQFLNLGIQGVQDGDLRWMNWFGSLSAGPFNTGCWPGTELAICMNTGKIFANRTVGGTAEIVPPPTLEAPSRAPSAATAAHGTPGGNPGGGISNVVIAAIAAIAAIVVALVVGIALYRKSSAKNAQPKFSTLYSDNAVFKLDTDEGAYETET